MKPAILRAMSLPQLREAIAAAETPAKLDALAGECDRRRSAGAAQAALTARLRCRALKAVATRRARQASMPQVAKADRGPLSLVSYLVKAGGIRDDRGDLRAMLGGSYRTRPGLVNNRGGLPLDRAAERALEDGYFPEHAGSWGRGLVAENAGGARREGGAAAESMCGQVLLDAIDAELRGHRRYPHGEAPDGQRHDAARDEFDRVEAERAQAEAWRQLRDAAEERGWHGAYDFLLSRGAFTPQMMETPF